ncbi:uncharacterized protein LOC111089710 [Limulus polyphemus]|uniref:Uncharacterized protein LOC111089710 n=1 Tax=Limulus polyphemus TaxID=6850 RepID=A0ABM1TR81_LIMPO|nr:uncharacterized protein LOC111089710 [Limulus polyphemus]
MKFDEFKERYRLTIILIFYILTTINCVQLQWYQKSSDVLDNVKNSRPRSQMKLGSLGRMFSNGRLRIFNSVLKDKNSFSIQSFTVQNEIVKHNSNSNSRIGPPFNRNDLSITNTSLTSNVRPIFGTDNYSTVMKKGLLPLSHIINNTWTNVSEENSQVGNYVISQKAPTFMNISQEVNSSLNKLQPLLNIKKLSDRLRLKQKEEISISTSLPSPTKNYRNRSRSDKLCPNISNRCITSGTMNIVNTSQYIELYNTTTGSTIKTKETNNVGLSQYVLQPKYFKPIQSENETWNKNGSRYNLPLSTINQIPENIEGKNDLTKDELESNLRYGSFRAITSPMNTTENLRLKHFTALGVLQESGEVGGKGTKEYQTNYKGMNRKKLAGVLKTVGKHKKVDYNRFVEKHQETGDRYYSMFEPGDSGLVGYKNHEFGWNKRKDWPNVVPTFTETDILESYKINSTTFSHLNHKSLSTVAQNDSSTLRFVQKLKQLLYSDVTNKDDLKKLELKETVTKKSVVDEKVTFTNEDLRCSLGTRSDHNYIGVLNEEDRISVFIIAPVVGILLLVFVILVAILLIKRKQLKLYTERNAKKKEHELKPLLAPTIIENNKMFRNHHVAYLPRKSSTVLFDLASPSTSILSVSDGPSSKVSHVPKVNEYSSDDVSIVDAYLKFHRSLPSK